MRRLPLKGRNAMPLSLSERTLAIAPSVTLAIDSRAKQLRAEGMDVIGFSAGEPDFCTPEYINDAGKFAIDAGITRYTPVAGTLDLRQKICEKFFRDNSVEYTPAEVIVSSGAKQSIFTALSAILNPGDEVLLPSPCWLSYPEMVRMAGGVPVMVHGHEDNNFVVTADMLRPYVTEKTKALIINSPNNPNGCVWSHDELMAIAELAVECGFYVISDEIYGDLTYGGEKHVCFSSLPGMQERTILLNGFSKAYAMTGWRIGYALGNKAFISAMTKIHQYTMLCAPITAQIAAIEALRHGEKYMKKMVAEYDRRRHLIYDGFTKMGLPCFEPKGAFYIFPDITSTGYTSDEFAEELLKAEHVALIPGSAFGACGEGHVRCSYATSIDKISEALARIENFLKNHKR